MTTSSFVLQRRGTHARLASAGLVGVDLGATSLQLLKGRERQVIPHLKSSDLSLYGTGNIRLIW